MTVNEARAWREMYAQDRGRASYYWEVEYPSGLIVREFEVMGADVPLTTIKQAPPYMLWARPYRPTDFPAINILIEEGSSPIWEHQVSWSIAMNVETEALIFGVMRPDEKVTEILKVYHTGDHFVFSGTGGTKILEDARYHFHRPAIPNV